MAAVTFLTAAGTIAQEATYTTPQRAHAAARKFVTLAGQRSYQTRQTQTGTVVYFYGYNDREAYVTTV